MVPLERALVTSYRLSIVTFPLSVRVSEILPLLCSSTPLFPTPKFPHAPPGSRWMAFGLWATKSEGVRQIARAISFQDFLPMWSWSTNVTDRQTDRRTDGRTTCDRKTALCTVVHRAVKMRDGPHNDPVSVYGRFYSMVGWVAATTNYITAWTWTSLRTTGARYRVGHTRVVSGR